MKSARCIMLLTAVFVPAALRLPCCLAGNDAPTQSSATLSGSGQASHIPIWKDATTLGTSVIYASGGNVGIGTTAPAARLEVNGDAQVDGNFTLGGRIISQDAGVLLWAPNNGSFNFRAGLQALPVNTAGYNNTAVGDQALQSNTGGHENTALGYLSLQDNDSGNGNSATGFRALACNTSGSSNTAVGHNALLSNTTANENTAIGFSALLNNTTAAGNTAVGFQSLFLNVSGASNTAIGDEALDANNTGDGNTAAGFNTLSYNTSGNDNTAYGAEALGFNTTGSFNIALGVGAGGNITNTSNNIHIGNQGTATDSGTIRIGTAGIQTSAYLAGVYGKPTGLAGVPVVVDPNGQLGTISSSRRYKEDIQDMGDASSGLLRLRPVTFRYKKMLADGSKPVQFGLIAEEVAEVYPDLVARSADGTVETVRYQLLDSMLLNELQKQNAMVTAQEEQIRDQQERIRSLEDRLARIESALGYSVSATSR